MRRLWFPIVLFSLSAHGAGKGLSTVSFTTYAAENFRILAKQKKPSTQVAFQDTSMFRLPASAATTPIPPPEDDRDANKNRLVNETNSNTGNTSPTDENGPAPQSGGGNQ